MVLKKDSAKLWQELEILGSLYKFTKSLLPRE